MTIDEAIKDLTELHKVDLHAGWGRKIDAIKLGIEALKRCKYLAEHTERWSGVLLPGETKE